MIKTSNAEDYLHYIFDDVDGADEEMKTFVLGLVGQTTDKIASDLRSGDLSLYAGVKKK